MARRIWVRNHRVKGGGYYRTIRGGGPANTAKTGRAPKAHRLSSGMPAKHRIGGTVGSGKLSASQRQRQRDRAAANRRITAQNLAMNRGGSLRSNIDSLTKSGDKQPRSTKAPKSARPKKTGSYYETTVRFKGRGQRPHKALTLGTSRSHAAEQARKLHGVHGVEVSGVEVGKRHRAVRHPSGGMAPPRVTRFGDKQPRSTKPPTSRKPTKTGSLSFKSVGKNVKTAQGRKANTPAVKKAQGKKRTLSEAQKTAKRARAKARRARRK